VSGSSIQIGIDDLKAVEDPMEVDTVVDKDGGERGECDEDGSDQDTEVTSPVRRSSRQLKKAEKVRLASEVHVERVTTRRKMTRRKSVVLSRTIIRGTMPL
jgi:hypothetical protein